MSGLKPFYGEREHKGGDGVNAGQIPPMPQNLPELDAWAASCETRGLIDASERQVLSDYARYGAEVVKVDDFGPDFGMLDALKKRQQALANEPEEIHA